jgi:hypothetical protein
VLPIVWESRSASSVEATGMIAFAPWASAAHIDVVARRMSITNTVRP